MYARSLLWAALSIVVCAQQGGKSEVPEGLQPGRCGINCLYMVLRLHGVPATLEELDRLADRQPIGTTLAGLRKAAEAKGVACRAVACDLDDLRGATAILILTGGHAVLLRAVTDRGALVLDPPEEPRFLPPSDLEKSWTHRALVFSAPRKPGRIEFLRTHHDYGRLRQHVQAPCDFEFLNAGEGTLRIERVAGGCSCTTAALTKMEYAPGEKGKVGVVFKTGSADTGPAGTVTKPIVVYTNDPGNPRTYLSISASIVPDVYPTPSSLIFTFTESNRHSKQTQEVKLHNAWEEPVEVLRASTDLKGVSVEQVGPESLVITAGSTGLEQYDVAAGFVHIALHVPSERDERTAQVPVLLRAQRRVIAVPDLVTLVLSGAVPPEVKTVTLKHLDRKAISVRSIAVSGRPVKAAVAASRAQTRDQVLIDIQGDPAQLGEEPLGTATGYIEIEVKEEDGGPPIKVTIPWLLLHSQ